MYTLSSLADSIHELAVEKGWHPTTETDDDHLRNSVANLHAEVSEMWEAYRGKTLFHPCDKAQKMVDAGIPSLTCLEEELADIIIRALDTSRRMRIDIERAVLSKHAFNATRSFRHGGKAA